MSYSTPTIPSAKEILTDYNAASLRHFRVNQNRTLDLIPPSLLPWIVANQNEPIHYEKTSPIKQFHIITKDDEFDSFTWHTTVGQLKKATRYGMVKTQSVTGQVISALGKYRLITLNRIKSGIISNRYEQKERLLDHYQDRFEALQVLESLANTGSDQATFKAALVAYQEKSKAISQQDDDSVTEFIKHLNQADANRATGYHSIITFVKTQMVRNLREMQSKNQILTFDTQLPFAAMRGDLDSCIEDAEKVIEDYQVSPRDIIVNEHHGIYGLNDDQPIVYDSSFHCETAEDEQRALLAAGHIEGLFRVDVKQPALVTKEGVRSTLKRVAATQWEGGTDSWIRIKIIAAWFVNVCIKFSVGLIELPMTVLVEPLTFGHFKSIFKNIRFLATREIEVENPDAPDLGQLQDLLDEAKRPPTSLGSRIKYLLRVLFKNTFVDLIYGIRDIYTEFSLHIFKEVYVDYLSGAKQPLALAEVLALGNKEIQWLEKESRERLAAILPKGELSASCSSNERLAHPDYLPTVFECDDLLNASVTGMEGVSSFFLHNIHAKNSVAGLMFSTMYVVGGMAVLAPGAMSFLGNYVLFCQKLGYSMSKSAVTAAISSGATQAQVASSVFDLLVRGPSSAPVAAAKAFEYDPFTSLLYAALALGLGDLIVYHFNIPWLSDSLKNDMGTAPATALPVVGAKLAIGLFELLREHQAPDLDNVSLLDHAKPANEAMASLLTFLMIHRHQLANLSVNTKFQLEAQIKLHFNRAMATSLLTLLSPEERTSIFRTTLRILVGYPVLAARCLAAGVSSLVLFNPKPLQRASGDLLTKTAKDMTRLGLATFSVARMVVTVIRRHVKTVMDVLVNDILARLQALTANRHDIGQAGYRASAALDVLYEQSRQVVGVPLDACIKAVTPAHPFSTERQCALASLGVFRHQPVAVIPAATKNDCLSCRT